MSIVFAISIHSPKQIKIYTTSVGQLLITSNLVTVMILLFAVTSSVTNY